MEALKVFPKMEVKLNTEKGIAFCQKIDIFKGLMWYCYDKDFMNWHELPVAKVNKIIQFNKQGKKVESLEAYAVEESAKKQETYNNVVGQDSLTRFDQPKTKKPQNRKRGGKNRRRKQNRNA
jgi:hypothetical protein